MNNAIYDIAVIGGGAAGLSAAIHAAYHGASVVILEKNDTCGKKILATGNGKCNYTNEEQGVSHYHGADPAFAVSVISRFDHEDTKQWFQKMGVLPYHRNGYVYPANQQASAIRDALLKECDLLGIQIITSVQARGFVSNDDGNFTIPLQGQGKKYKGPTEVLSRKVIVTCGGMAAPKTGSNGDGYYWFKKIGVDLVPQVPSLVALKTNVPYISELAGIRIRAKASLYISETYVDEQIGEVQFTRDTVSGIPVFQLSSRALYGLAEGKDVEIRIGLLPDFGMEDILVHMKEQCHRLDAGVLEDLFLGLLPVQMVSPFLAGIGFDQHQPVEGLNDKDIELLVKNLKEWKFPIMDSLGYDHAQTTAGGISTNEISSETMEVQKVPGLYVAGEIVDIDGECGGYNLQWAWSSGALAGQAAAQAV